MADSDILAIWQGSLSNIGSKASIASLTEQSAEAAACALNYQRVITAFARDTDWNRLRYTAELEDITEDFAPPARWAYRYAFPEGCVALRRMDAGGVPIWTWSPVPMPYVGFEIGVDLDAAHSDRPTTYIYSNLADLTAIYTRYIFDLGSDGYEGLFDGGMAKAASWALAEAIAPSLTGNAQIIAAARASATQSLADARAANANENAPNVIDDGAAESLTVRGLVDDDRWPWR